MALANFQLPDGRVAQFDIPEGMSPAEAEKQIQALLEQQAPPEQQQPPGPSDQDRRGAMEWMSQMAQAAGKNPMDFMKFIGPAVANTLIGMRGFNFSLPQAEVAATLASGAAAEPVAGIAGLASAVDPRTQPGAGASAVEDVRQQMTYQPSNPGARLALDLMGQGVQAGRNVLGRAGEYVGGPAGRTIAENAPDVIGTVLGGRAALTKAGQVATRPPAPTKESRALEALTRGEGDRAGAGYQLQEKPNPIIEQQKWTGEPGNIPEGGMPPPEFTAVKDPLQQNLLKQGEDPGIVAEIQAATPAGKNALAKQVEIVRRGKENTLFARNNRPLDVVGESLANRIEVVKSANEIAARKLRGVANDLKGQYPDMRPALVKLRDMFDESNIGYQLNDEGRLVLDFTRSDFRGMKGIQRKIQSVVDEMQSSNVNDAFDWHTFKRYIDTQVAYGKQRGKMPKQAERILKGLRNAVDGVLDETYPEYRYVNDVYSETINALNNMQDAWGSKVDLTGPYSRKDLGLHARKLLSNYGQQGPQRRAVDELTSLADKYSSNATGGPSNEIVPVGALGRISGVTAADLNDSFLTQVGMASILESRFPSHAPNSLGGIMAKNAEGAADAAETINQARGGAGAATMAGIRYATKKLKRQSDDKYLQALLDLLKRGEK